MLKPTKSIPDTIMETALEALQEAGFPSSHDAIGTRPSSGGPARGQDDRVHSPSPAPRSDDNMRPVPEAPPEDAINPSHYRKHPSGIECIEVTRHMNFNTGNAIKYIWRYLDKGDPIENLQKAQWYLDDEIRRLQGLR
jgi:Protein of unknwon function (DUF3310)